MEGVVEQANSAEENNQNKKWNINLDEITGDNNRDQQQMSLEWNGKSVTADGKQKQTEEGRK